MKKLLFVALMATCGASQAQVPLPTATKIPDSPPSLSAHASGVTYSVDVMRGGKVVRTQNFSTVVGTPHTAMFGDKGAEAICSGRGALGQRYTLQTALGNEFKLTVFPVTNDGGAIKTIVQAAEAQAALKIVEIDEGCVVPAGHAESSSVFDVAAMRKGEKRTLNFGDGTTLVVKLTGIDG